MLHHHQAGLAFSSQRKQSQTLSGEFGKRSGKDFPGLFCQSLASSSSLYFVPQQPMLFWALHRHRVRPEGLPDGAESKWHSLISEKEWGESVHRKIMIWKKSWQSRESAESIRRRPRKGMEVVQWGKQCIYAIIWAINEVQNHKTDLFLNLMSDSPALTEGWTLSCNLPGRNQLLYMSRFQGRGDYSRCPCQSSAILRWEDPAQCFLSESSSPCLRKRKEGYPAGTPFFSIIWDFWFKIA